MILITRPKKDSYELQQKLKKIKIDSLVQELSSFKILKSRIDLSNSIILITSSRSIDYLVKSKTLETCKKSKFLVIGKTTSMRLRQLGCKRIIVSASNSKELLKKSKLVLKKKETIKFLCSNIFNKELLKSLNKLNYNVVSFKVYKTLGIKKLKKSVVKNLKQDKIVAAVFFSQFSLSIFFKLCKTENIKKSTLKKLHYLCISKRVAYQATQLGYKVHLSKEPTKDSILKLMKSILPNYKNI